MDEMNHTPFEEDNILNFCRAYRLRQGWRLISGKDEGGEAKESPSSSDSDKEGELIFLFD